MEASKNVTVKRFKADSDGCVAYMVTSRSTLEAAVIDPRLDQVDAIIKDAEKAGIRIRWVLDTHTHADHLSGVARLAESSGAAMAVHRDSKSRLAAKRLDDREQLVLGASRLEILHAPGHTPDSLAVLVEGHIFTGDTMLVGGAGRTDFMGGSASALFDTYQKFHQLPATTVVHPGHDYLGKAESTLGEEATTNSAFRETVRENLVRSLDTPRPVPANMPAILEFNMDQPRGSTLTPVELAALLDKTGAPLLLDVRTPQEYASEHVTDAVNIPLDQLDSRINELRSDAEYAILCRTGIRSVTASQLLGRHGIRSRVVAGGVTSWAKLDLPLIEGRKQFPIDRQVQLIVGLAVMTGVVLGLTVHTAFLAIPAFFGAGLTFAGATGTCPLALVLGWMPWNRSDVGAGAATGSTATCSLGTGAAATGTCAASKTTSVASGACAAGSEDANADGGCGA